ncbi:hypothetical protein EIP91_010495 [Steccherinum ochraceum]|uniref:Pentacotripeptide-repeat region of PRORP domain-containing protein n=1 Tax=Steccherinum ochraceum TaxID=92696 RepID=A0A4R0RIZ0_9APHY|nr:hypothetical protein EIP91_010495 [Steccherinum ochraceum]
MSNCTKLPPALLDLIIARAFAPPILCSTRSALRSPFKRVVDRRHSHAVAYNTTPSAAPYLPPPSLPLAPRPQLPDFVRQAFPDVLSSTPEREMTELEQRVRALTSQNAEESFPDDSLYSDDELLLIYEDLLAMEPSSQQKKGSNVESDAAILKGISERLLPPSTSPFHEQLLRIDLTRLSGKSTDTISAERTSLPDTSVAVSYKDILSRLEELVAEIAPSVTQNGTALRTSEGPSLPISTGVMTEREWSALIRACTQQVDLTAVHSVFDLMKRSASEISEANLNTALTIFAEKGDVQAVESLLQKYLTAAPTDIQRDLHIKSYLRASAVTEVPTKALSILHDYEARALPAPQRTYTRCITHLFSAKSSIGHAHAWDLFSHMRYAAHPVPDATLYSLMIRACATASFSTGVEPERALDLFHEMTVDQRIEPTSGAYTAAILACACSGKKNYVHEAFRLAKQMLDSHRDARGISAFSPDMSLFKALLQGAKRIGDLGRARWLLAEMVKMADDMEFQGAGSSAAMRIDEEAMVHVFNAYAAYRPPFRRSATKVMDASSVLETSAAPQGAEMDASTSSVEQQTDVVDGLQKSSFTHLPPQTRADLIAEVRLLMDQIMEQSKSEGADGSTARFKHVQLTPRLVNAFLSVHYAHSSLQTCIDMYRTVFAELGVSKNARSYVEALERLCMVRKEERPAVKSVADEIWSEWQSIEEAWRQGDSSSLRLSARIVERANSAMIRLFSLTGQIDRALSHVKSFVEKYPFPVVRTPAPRDPYRSTRTILTGARPLVRFTSAVDVPDDTVPPFLTFQEVEVLHHKLIAAKNAEGIKYLTWVCKSYEGALRKRREKTLQGRNTEMDRD